MILGLDMATKKTGYSVLKPSGELVDYGAIRADSKNVHERFKTIYDAVQKIMERYPIKCVVFEDVPVARHSNLKTGKDLSILQGVIVALCYLFNLPYILYTPSAWRSVIGTYDGTREGTKRAAQKQAAVNKVNEVYNLGLQYYEKDTKAHPTDDDIAEAICIALAYIKEMETQGGM